MGPEPTMEMESLQGTGMENGIGSALRHASKDERGNEGRLEIIDRRKNQGRTYM